MNANNSNIGLCCITLKDKVSMRDCGKSELLLLLMMVVEGKDGITRGMF